MVGILLIGPLPPPMGGNTRHFATLVEDLDGHDGFRVKVIDTSRGEEHSRPLRNFLVAFRTLLTVAANLGSADVVSYHASNRGMLMFGPLIVGLCKLARKRTVLRMFGGSFGDLYLSRNRIGRAFIRRCLLSADVVLLQTRRSVEQLRRHAVGRVEWFSTYVKTGARSLAAAENPDASEGMACTRFVFLGHLWRTKGLETMLEAAPHLPSGCFIDVYGPLDEYTTEEIRKRGMGCVRYRGFLSHTEVDAKLWEYDCLVLATFHSSEGYPGVIAEAFAHGLPVITTRWLAIPEIVDEECGILIEPEDTRGLIAAITALHEDRARWLKLKEAARARAGQFDHALWARKFEEICERLVEGR